MFKNSWSYYHTASQYPSNSKQHHYRRSHSWYNYAADGFLLGGTSLSYLKGSNFWGSCSSPKGGYKTAQGPIFEEICRMLFKNRSSVSWVFWGRKRVLGRVSLYIHIVGQSKVLKLISARRLLKALGVSRRVMSTEGYFEIYSWRTLLYIAYHSYTYFMNLARRYRQIWTWCNGSNRRLSSR